MKNFKYLIVFLLFITITQNVFGAIERFSNRMDGDNSTNPLVSGSSVTVYDDKYFDMSTDPFWATRFANKKASGYVRLGINPDLNLTTGFSGSQSIEINYWTWNTTSGGFDLTTVTKVFNLSYSTTATTPVDDQSTFTIDGAQRITVRLLSGTLPLANLYLEAGVEVERYYTLDNNAVANLVYTILNPLPTAVIDGPQIEFRWDTKLGAESYELEWVHVNSYKLASGTYFTESELSYNFYLNSTRIETKQNWYRIPHIFDHGYIVFRVRPIGKTGTNFIDRQEGTWSVINESGLISSFPTANKIPITSKYSNLNWAHVVNYSEDGKRVEGISYTDGLGRNHQLIGYNPINNQVIVSNKYYDELGRIAVSDIPTPVNGAWMKFQPNFNRANVPGFPSYSWQNFDSTVSDSCLLNSAGFTTTTGAGLYYSPSNPNQNGANVAIPDAEKYPFTRIVFTNDYSNRLSRIALAGDDLKIGSGKEKKIFYPSTNQQELDQLFGSEVGYAKHYEKMITLDGNGQIYVQYSDLSGKVVASYMEGPSPNNVDGTEGNSSSPLLVTMVDQGTPQQINTSVPYSEISYSQYVSSDTTFNFNYYFTPSQFESACTGNLCLDCIYDLSIEVFDNCGQPVTLNGYSNPVQITGSNIDSIINGTCNGGDNYEASFSANLTKGMYTIHKKLTVNEDAIDDYWCLYLEANNCIEGVQSIFDSLYLAEPFLACAPQTIEEEELDECESAKAIMLFDVSPGGQYGLYNGTTWTSTDAYSVYNPSGQLSVNWRSLTYLDANGVAVPSSTLAGTAGLQWFVNNFRDEWAEVLLAYHPEKCYLDFCFANSASNQYNNEMLAINSFEGAKTAGFLMPLTGGVPNSNYSYFPSSMPSYLDPFFTTGGMGVSQASTMVGTMNHYIDIMPGYPLSMWEYALYMVAGGSCRKDNLSNCMPLDDCNKDLVWLTFRELYLQEKATQVFLAQQAYAAAHGCSNDCIGKNPPCSGTPAQLATRTSRFGNLGQFASTTTNPATQADSEIEMNALIAEACSTSCEGYANQWLADLAGCAPISTLTPTELQALKDEFIELCMLGCDKDHPMGATTAPSGEETANHHTDIQGILDFHLGGKPGYPSANCSPYLISVPGPYQNMDAMLNDIPIMDQCGCDILMDVRTDYQAGITNNTIPATTTLETYLNIYKGISLDDVDNLLCVCDQFYDETNNTWLPNADASIRLAKKYVPKELTCEVTVACKTCDEVSAAYTAAYTYVSEQYDLDASEFEASSTYESILTAYLNQQFGYDLTFLDYDFFHRGCTASSAEPVCEMNPIMNEFKDMMSLLAMRRQFVHSSPLNLVNENIVYKHGRLRDDEILGSSYSTTTSSGHLIASFQTGSQTPCTFDFSIAGNPTFDFSKVVSFGDVWATTTNCTANTNFEIEVKYYECGQLVTKVAQVSSTCLQVNFCYCGDNGQRLCDQPLFDPNYSICYQPTLDELMQTATETYEASVSAAYALFKEEYKSQCAEAFSTEHFDMQGRYRFYQYTLYYYDQAGNLIKTVAPKGVNKLNPTQVAAAQANRDAVTDVTSTSPAVVPTQEYITKYRYNSYNQLVSTENPDQEGMTKYWYDFYGRKILSQNPEQAAVNKYSYTFYDKKGRTEEAGLVVPATALGSIDIKAQDPLATAFRAWVTASGSTRTEVTKTYYDKVFMPAVQSRFTLQPGQTVAGQQNLRLRIASTAYYNTITPSTNLTTGYASATHYTYDLHGNILQTLQDVPELAPVLQNIKSTEYEFEMISGNLKTIKYQKDQPDQITHSYIYDKLNRMEEVFVSTDKVHQSRQAHYLYTEYGSVARVEIGEQKVQGMDFTYTINDWVKSMNGTTLNPGYELGRDNTSGYLSQNTSVHSKFAKDVVGYTLGYFKGDYQSIGSTNFMPSPYGVSTLNSAISQLYNGNIAYTTSAIADVPSGPAMAIQMGVYRYDQLNRLVSARTFRASGLAASNNWSTASETQEYKSTYTYDQNGNLKTLLRNGGSSNLNMDNFVYQPELLTSGAKTNRLDYVDDNPGYSGNYSQDIDDQALDNYGYDKLGQLTRDNSEGSMTIEWYSANRKVKKITRTGRTIEFKYNPFGQRIMKIVRDGDYDGQITYYSYDATGKVMAIYSMTTDSYLEASLDEFNLYGATHLGTIKRMIPLYDNGPLTYTPANPCAHTLGYKRYEVNNYLRNVNAVITDRKLYVSGSYQATMVLNADYYPFGMEMPGRNTNIGTYRYGYNGMEMDIETKGNGHSYTTEFRQYDPRLGKWLSLDPLMAKYPQMSPYSAFNNNPIYFIDPEGLEGTNNGNPSIYNDGGDEGCDEECESANTSGSGGGHDFTNYPLSHGGTITLYKDAKDIVLDKNKNLQSFTLYNKTYTYSVDGDGDFRGFRTSDDELYQGKTVFNNLPWYYYDVYHYRNSPIKWPVTKGGVKTGHGEWEERPFESKVFQAFLAGIVKELATTPAGRAALAKISKDLLKEGVRENVASLLSLTMLFEFNLERRSSYQYQEVQDWYGHFAHNGFNSDYSYIVPIGMSDVYEKRVGVAKYEWRVVWRGHDLGTLGDLLMLYMTEDVIEDMTVPTSTAPPTSINKH